MDIRTRLIFALVAMSLASMAALGTFAYGEVTDLLRTNYLERLEAVAARKELALERVLVAWSDRVRLLSTRGDLQRLLARASAAEAGGGSPSAEDFRRAQRLLGEAVEAIPSLQGMRLYTRGGSSVMGAGVLPPGDEPGPEALAQADPELRHPAAVLGPNGELQVSYLAPLHQDDRRVGSAWVVLSGDELSEVMAETIGLGRTGESAVLRLETDGSARLITALRHDPDAALRRSVTANGNGAGPELRAAWGSEGTWTDLVDYRGEPVVAATRWLEEPGWGLLVKIDVAEEREAPEALRSTLLKLALSLSAFSIVAGMVLAQLFARPILDLAQVARRVRHGEWDLRADEGPEDEVGQLGVIFNEMKDELVTSNRDLSRRLQNGENGEGEEDRRS